MHSSSKKSLSSTLMLALGALGVVYGDIGTSPLYAIKEIFFGHHEMHRTPENVLGVISIVLWALTLIISFKYVLFVLRADNDGEGGVFALYSLLHKKKGLYVKVVTTFLMLAAGLLIGDGIITPAISVISAVEGLQVATTAFTPYVVPITFVILTCLFAVQSKGTAKIGAVFGPIIGLWFISIGLIGLKNLLGNPEILAALNPYYAVSFFMHHDFRTILTILGSVMLVVTGGEAMFADMGHFGIQPIRISWFSLTYPALILNYLGQGAFLLSGKEVVSQNIFFSMVPSWGLYPMILLATCATIIASQALITGAFSLITQAISLGLTPYMKITHTNHEHEGQIYIRTLNWALYAGCVWLVFTFRTSSNLASAYGLAVAGDMLITTLSMLAVARLYWNWSFWKIGAILAPFIFVDFMFLTANSLKLFQGGYVPLTIGVIILLTMRTWVWGRRKVKDTYKELSKMTMKELVKAKDEMTHFIPRSIVIMSPIKVNTLSEKVPFLEQVFWERYGQLPQHLIFLTVVILKQPHVHDDRYSVKKFYHHPKKGSITAVQVNFGYMEDPNVEDILEGLAGHHEISIDEHPSKWLIHVAQERLYKGHVKTLFQRVRYRFFNILLKNSETADHYFGIGKEVPLTIESIPIKLG